MRKLLNNEIYQLAGSYSIGGTVVIFTHDESSTLVNVHEQTHRDNINNTFFGYWLVRLTDFTNRAPWNGMPPAEQLVSEAISGAWNTLEGAAVCAEHLHLRMGFADTREEDWLALLPDDYMRAYDAYRSALHPFLSSGAPPGLLHLSMATMVHAVAECALDDALLGLAAPPDQFQVMHDKFSGVKPDAVVQAYLKATEQISHRQIASNLQHPEWLLEGSDMARALRSLVMAHKKALFDIVRTNSPIWILSDKEKAGLKAQVDAALCAAFPELPYRRNAPRYVGPAMSADLKAYEPKHQLPLVSIGAELAAQHIKAAQQRSGAFSTAVVILKYPSEDRYTASVVPITERSDDHVASILLEAEIVNFEGPERLIRELDIQFGESEFFWCSYLLQPELPNSTKPYDWDFIRTLQAPVFLYFSIFDAAWLSEFVTFLDCEVTLTAAKVDAVTGQLDALCLSVGNIRIFWVVAGAIDQLSKQRRQMDLGGHLFRVVDECEKSLFAAIRLILSGMGSALERESKPETESQPH
ncbi:MAG: hypothetical protein WCF16_04365 [Alphaproteobacteria bacterium]